MGFFADIGRTLKKSPKKKELPTLQALPEISHLPIPTPIELPVFNVPYVKQVQPVIIEPSYFTAIKTPLPLSRVPSGLPMPITSSREIIIGAIDSDDSDSGGFGDIPGGFTDISDFVEKLFTKLIELIKIIIKSVKIGVKFSEFMFIISPFFILVILLLYVFVIVTE